MIVIYMHTGKTLILFGKIQQVEKMSHTCNPMTLKPWVVLMSWTHAILRKRIYSVYSWPNFKLQDVDEDLHNSIRLHVQKLTFQAHKRKGYTEKLLSWKTKTKKIKFKKRTKLAKWLNIDQQMLLHYPRWFSDRVQMVNVWEHEKKAEWPVSTTTQ